MSIYQFPFEVISYWLAAYKLNQVLFKSVSSTPYKLWIGQKPNLTHLRCGGWLLLFMILLINFANWILEAKKKKIISNSLNECKEIVMYNNGKVPYTIIQKYIYFFYFITKYKSQLLENSHYKHILSFYIVLLIIFVINIHLRMICI